jgi:hypothetical protein
VSEPSPSDYPTDPTDRQILDAAASIARGDGVPGLGDLVERLHFVEREAQLDNAKLRFLFGYWQAIRARKADGLVAKSDIDIVELKGAMGNLLLLDVEREGLDAVYRVYGTGVAEQAGRDWTGWRVSDMNRQARTPLALLYRACYRAVYETLEPLYSCSKSPPWLQFLVGNIPVEPRPLSYEERQAIRKKHET